MAGMTLRSPRAHREAARLAAHRRTASRRTVNWARRLAPTNAIREPAFWDTVPRSGTHRAENMVARRGKAASPDPSAPPRPPPAAGTGRPAAPDPAPRRADWP